MKKILSVFIAICILMSLGSVTYVSSADDVGDDEQIEQTFSVKAVEGDYEDDTSRSVVEPSMYSNEADYIDYIANGNKDFTFTELHLNIDELISGSTDVTTQSNGNVTGTFKSAKMKTGTPFVKWYYSVNYVLEPYANGYGWRFKSVGGYVYVQKGWLLYTWATSCIVTIEEATYALNSPRTSVTIRIKLKFDVTTNATYGVLTYHENHSHTTSISNVGPN